MPTDWLQQQGDSKCLEKELLYASLISSAAIFENDTVMCDTGNEVTEYYLLLSFIAAVVWFCYLFLSYF